MFVSALVRLITIFFALILALLAAGLLIGYGAASGLVPELVIEGSDPEQSENFEYLVLTIATVGIGALASFQLAGLVGIPLLLVILATEMMRWRGMVTHLLLGGVVALFAMFTSLPEGVAPKEGTVIVTLAAGFIAAFVYWLVAGRSAGKWMGEDKREPSSSS